jgi:hypothetical protein
MKSFHQRTILQRVDCLLVYTEEQVEMFSSLQKPCFTLKSPPKEVAKVLWKAQTLYVHPDGFDHWIDVLQVLHQKHPLSIKLFIFAGSDLSITDEHIEFWTMLFPSAKFWIQNYLGTNANCSIFPIGVNQSIEMEEQEKTQPLVISYFNPLNSKERTELEELLEKEDSLKQYRLPNCSLPEYLKGISNAYFSVCPTGNGYDSFRFWESLSVGAIPLVVSTPFMESLMEHHPELPFIILEKWEDLPSFLHSEIQKVYDMYMNMSNLEILTESYWQKQFDDILETSDETNQSNTKEEVSLSETTVEKTQREFDSSSHESSQTNHSELGQEVLDTKDPIH